MGCHTFEVGCTQFGFAFEPGNQSAVIVFSPTLDRTVFVEEELSLLLVVDQVRIALHELLQFLLTGSNGEGSILNIVNTEFVIRIKAFKRGDLVSHSEGQSTGVASLLA